MLGHNLGVHACKKKLKSFGHRRNRNVPMLMSKSRGPMFNWPAPYYNIYVWLSKKFNYIWLTYRQSHQYSCCIITRFLYNHMCDARAFLLANVQIIVFGKKCENTKKNAA